MMVVIDGLFGSLAVSILAKVTVTTALALVGTRLARRSRAAVRHALLAAAFAVLLVLPIASLIGPSIRIAVPIAAQNETPAPRVEVAADPRSPAPVDVLDRAPRATPESSRLSISAVLFAGWAVGATLLLLPVVVGVWQLRSLRRSTLPWREGQSIVESLAIDAGIHRPVEVRLHEFIPGPMTCGALHPAIVMPLEAQTWAEEATQRAIVHELEHVRRGDWISQCLARVVCAVYWFHPLVWIAWSQLALEAERACDDAVLRRSSTEPGAGLEATAYADQLVLLAQRLSTVPRQPLLAMANRADLATRVAAVLDNRQMRGRAGAFAVFAVCAAAALLVTTISPLRIVAARVAGQSTADRPAFEVASIKPCSSGDGGGGGRGGGGGFTTSPGRVSIQCMNVADIIYRAYVQFGDPPPVNPAVAVSDIVQKGRAWVYSDRYTIEAKATGTPPRTTMMGAMLRTLLEDRLQLKIHHDAKEVPAYALTVAKDGFKLQPVGEGSCTPRDPNYAGGSVLKDGHVFRVGAADGEKPLCSGNVGRGPNETNLTYDATGQALDEVSRTLARLILQRPVIDRTGIKGQFSFRVAFAPDESTPGVARPPWTSTTDPSDPSGGPSIFTAFEQQLGLKLQPTKGPQGFFVIDRVERPSPN